ncbi:hypothetical protein, partial [Burkholderia contaminans]
IPTGIAPRGVFHGPPSSFDAAVHPAASRVPTALPRDFRARIGRAIETHAATAHKSFVRHDIVCALRGVFFTIRNASMRLNRNRKQSRTSCATPSGRLVAHFF